MVLYSLYFYLSYFFSFNFSLPLTLLFTAKGRNVKSRMSELFALIPEIRSIGVWHQELMRQMKINVQLQEVHQLFDAVNYRES